ncbi:MAG: hypothetical protein DRR08_22605 [Candidatus Parabeggiatoa sp. nov. 2]|nr:MAG: hypothetical protein DRR08_22605 [Gammaproteobacteria bacterium]
MTKAFASPSTRFRLQTEKFADFRESRQTKEGNHKGLSLHAREGLWAIPRASWLQKNRKVDRVEYLLKKVQKNLPFPRFL